MRIIVPPRPLLLMLSCPLPPAGAVQISIASGGNKTEWMRRAIGEFNAASQRDSALQVGGRPVVVESLQENVGGRLGPDYRSGTLVADILSGKIKPAIV